MFHSIAFHLPIPRKNRSSVSLGGIKMVGNHCQNMYGNLSWFHFKRTLVTHKISAFFFLYQGWMMDCAKERPCHVILSSNTKTPAVRSCVHSFSTPCIRNITSLEIETLQMPRFLAVFCACYTAGDCTEKSS